MVDLKPEFKTAQDFSARSAENSVKKAKIGSIRTNIELIKEKVYQLLGYMRHKEKSILRKLFYTLLILLMAKGVVFSQEKRIVIVKSSESPSFQMAAEGVKKEIRKGSAYPSFIEYDLPLGFPNEQELEKRIRESSPDLIVTVGSKSTALVSRRIKNIPIVFSAVLNPVSSGFARSMWSSGNNLTGASLDIPIRTQLDKFKLIFPDLQNVGVIFTHDSEAVVGEARKVCEEMGLKLVAVAISSEKQIPETIESLRQKVDGLWAVADTVIFTPQSTQYLLLYTLRNGIPVMGPFTSFVKAGALFTLTWNDKDIGRQAGELALRVLAGENPSQIPITTPRMIYLILNQRTAEQINLEIPPHIVSVAKEVYQ